MGPSADAPPPSNSRNPMLWLVIGLPVLAIVASLASYWLAATRGDRELPAAYHWEGQAFDQDEARMARARELGLTAEVQVDGAAGRCVAVLADAAGQDVLLDFTHPTDSHADRHLSLALEAGAAGSGARYGAPCAPLPAAHWWVQVSDPAGRWLLRGRVQGALAQPATLSPPFARGATAAAAPP